MAGVVAMAAVIEEFEPQPCKKSCKDGDVPVKTITSYFSPVPKPTEKPFSPPRSNNIMDYFSRKAPASMERTSTPEQSKENCHRPQSAEKQPSPEAAVKQPAKHPQKRGRKPSKAARRLQETEAACPTEEDDCLVVEELTGGGDWEGQSISSCGVLGSDTAALLAQLCADACMVEDTSQGNDTDTVVEQGQKVENREEGKPRLNCNGLSPIAPSKDKVKRVKPVAKQNRKTKCKPVQSEAEVEETEQSLGDVSMEVNVSQLNSSTVTISFEDFLQSQNQGQDKEEKVEVESKITTKTKGTESDQLDITKADEKEALEEPSTQQVSPRSLTFQAEVHTIPLKQEPAKAVGKVASIFTRRKGAGSPAEVKLPTSPCSQVTPELLPASVIPNRKSNVVVLEEDLEFAVVESESTPKCSQVERKQFMAAFKQPSLDGAKTKPGKSQAKQKQPAENMSEAVEKAAEEDTIAVPSEEQSTTAGPEKKGTKKNPTRKGKKKAQKKDEEEDVSSPAAASQETPVATETVNEESYTKTEESTIASTTSVSVVRRSRREASLKQQPVDNASTPVSTPVRKTRSQVGSKDASVPQDSPLQMSTPKTHKSKRRVFKAEVVSPADEKGSPIRMKFTRVHRNTSVSEGASDFEILSPLATNTSDASKRRKQAKRVVEKAKAIQQSKKAAAEEKTTLRQSKKSAAEEKNTLRQSKKSAAEEKITLRQSKKSAAEEKITLRQSKKSATEKKTTLRQSRKSATEKQATLRRSTRTPASSQRSYCEDEDSVVCLEDVQTGPAQTSPEKAQTHLRSLNDVLGRVAQVSKDTKTRQASKVAPVFLGKKSQRVSAVVSILDESSHEGSENSQDDEQFRARREFLKSGLPESFKKQIAKTAATKEAYSLSCSSFHMVVHVLQTSQDSPFWSLPWPESSLFRCLKELGCAAPNPLPPLMGSFCCKIEPASRALCERGSGWREEFSEGVRQLLTEEVSASNPPFPIQRFLTRFLKRRADHLQQPTASEPEAVTRVASAPASVEPIGGKRKREDEGETTGKVAKKRRSRKSGEEQASTPEPPKRGGRVSCAQRRKLEEEEREKTTPLPSQSDSVVVLEDSPLGGKTGKEDVMKEDVLWTEKYQPQHSSDIIGNTSSVKKLHSWLKEWKLRADREERKKEKKKKQQQQEEEGSSDSDWDGGEQDTLDGEDMMCNTLLITGPTGVGKTAAVYACAQELGFKVFEVNASSQRSGRLILSQLKEATQSHQVDIQGVNTHKPSYFNSYGSSSVGAARPVSSPKKVNSPRRVFSSPMKRPQSPRSAKRGSLAPISLANFFKVGQPTNKEPATTEKTKQTAAPKKSTKAMEPANKPKELLVKTPPTSKQIPGEEQSKKTATSLTTSKQTPGEEQSKKTATSLTTSKQAPGEEQSKKTATSLILFEEVDVIFDDDSGFLAAIKTFMTTTKRPVILTTSDLNFSSMFDGSFEEIHFKTPSVLNVGSYLQLLCLAEGMRTDPRDISSLLRLNGCDIRRSLLQLQFWTRSAGGRHIIRPLTHAGNTVPDTKVKSEEPGEAVTTPTSLPPCDTGCTESMLGLLSVEPERVIQDLLKSQCPLPEAVSWELLRDSRRRGVDLLYSNMEILLPLPLKQLTTPSPTPLSVPRTQGQPSIQPQELPSTGPQPDGLTSHATAPQVAEVAGGSDDGTPVKVSNRMKKKRQHCLQHQDPLHSDSDSEDGFLSLRKPQSAPQEEEEEEFKGPQGEDVEMAPVKVKREPLTPEQRMKSVPVSLGLGSIGDFLDHMSYLDSNLLLRTTSPPVGDPHMMFSFPGVTEAKDGMADEPRMEFGRGSWAERERAVEIQAAVEALGFRRCRAGVEEAWSKAQDLEGEVGKEAATELTLPVAPHREGFSLAQDSPCQPKLLQRRREVIESLLSRGVCGTLGNRPAAALDYLPTLRTICRLEQLKEQGKAKRRFLHYLDAIHLGLPKSTLHHLAEDFP